ncbi:branched chain amino acid ABC transporter substrate-binding protein [Vulcanimicrobium alpinum]|uniref:Branched chain amino acid ABC transporter substrate-binding protein n=1 Tax=Vulcanimicrobium alpinum TaxID=3016050 RepID=A0AAN1XXG8_UNVUL|nr:branched-chain amino acid ABC transporter substrate-binding protein [Vulcanimicrobium alpinum]BDE07188.1 branched chain amino acid ABC transporter substrate-binding protein [Vulcanimicrobium alpinum]
MPLPPLMRIVLAAVLTAALAACGGGSSSSSSSGDSGGTIKIGVDLPVSGADASIGVPTQNGVVLAVEEANKNGFAGGKFKLEASLLDDAVQGKHDPAAGAQNVKTFIADSAVLAMVGPFNSNVAKSEIPLSNDAGLAQISPSNTNDGLTIGDDAKKLRTAHPDVNTYFRVCTRDAKQGAALAQTAAQRLKFKKVFVIDDNETYGKGLADVFDASFRQLGGTVLGHEHITANQVDFKALLTKVKSLNPDAVFFGGNTSTGGGLIRRQMADVGMGSIAMLGGDGIGDDEFEKQAGDAANGSYMTIAAPDASKLPSAKDFIAAYKARFNGDVGPYSANAYTAAKIEIAAIEKAIKDNGGKMPTRADVLKNIAATTDFESPIGKVGFDAAGDTTSPVLSLDEVKGGKRVVIDVITLKS